MKNRLIISFLSFLYLTSIYAYDYPVSDIPDSLKADAVSVIRDYSVEFTQSNKNSGVYKVSKVITILNQQGDKHAEFGFGGDIKFQELTKFSAAVRNASGNIIKKIKKGDLVYSSIDTESLATGGYSMHYTFQSPSYPYTIEYSYEVKYNNGIIAYPPFIPIGVKRQSLINANYKLILPTGLDSRYKANYDADIKKSTDEKNNIYTVSIKGIKPFSDEIYSPLFSEISPNILFAPTEFCFDSACGNMATWKDYGAWIYKLLEGRDVLPSELISKLNDIIKDAKSDREKVKIIFEYLQNNSRYISIQLGIGGLQPIESEKVYKAKFGDCKGLSNLMKAMLNAVGISSNYCEIYNGNNKDKHLYPDFANVIQTNHVILLVPLKNDSIWLECTSQTIPFGFIHDGIAGHDALVITETGGKICHLPSYPYDKRKTETNSILNIKEDGKVYGNLEVIEHLDVAQYVHSILKTDRKSQVDYINNELNLPKVQIGDIHFSMDKSSEPITSIKTSFEASDFINKTGNRLFVPTCPLNKGSFKKFSSNKRENDIYINNRYVYVYLDTIRYNLPEGYKVETLPKDIDLKNQFGQLNIQLVQDNNSIICMQKIELKPGKYNKSSYNELKDFFAQIDLSLKRKFVLRKE